MPNQKISELPENTQLFSDCVLELTSTTDETSAESLSDDLLFLGARENISNNKIKFETLKSSIIDFSFHKQQDQTINGKKIFEDPCVMLTRNGVDSISLEYYINNAEEVSAQGIFEVGKIKLNADQELAFLSNQNKNTFFSNSGCFNINSVENQGSIHAVGDLYTDSISVKKENNEYGSTQEDENISFAYKLQSGANTQTLYLPKTFKYKPIISATLFNANSDTYVPFCISNVTEYSFDVRFATLLSTSDYELHVSAFSPSILPDNSVNPVSDAKLIQRFATVITGQTTSQIIAFPFAYDSAPAVHATVESANKIVPHTISSVNNESYTINFGGEVDETYTIHTLSQQAV